MADIEMKVGSRRPFLDATLSDANGPVDISSSGTGSTSVVVRFVVEDRDSVEIINQTSTGPDVLLQNSTGGQVRYQWRDGDLTVAGRFYAEWSVDFGDGRQAHFPNTGHIPMVVKPALSTST